MVNEEEYKQIKKRAASKLCKEEAEEEISWCKTYLIFTFISIIGILLFAWSIVMSVFFTFSAIFFIIITVIHSVYANGLVTRMLILNDEEYLKGNEEDINEKLEEAKSIIYGG